jgi:tetratricopeptide (TPR) repeat protein
MRTSEQINSFWGLARESSADGERLRRRIGAMTAMSLLVCGFLLAIGLRVLVLAFLAGALVSAGVLVFTAVWPQVRAHGREWIAHLRPLAQGTQGFLVPLWQKAHGSSVTAVAAAGRRATAFARTAGESGSHVSRELAQAARTTAIRFAPRPARTEQQREALRLNAAGTQHRRNGLYPEAVESHRRALEILRALDDRRAVALTQSNLALALSRAGDDEWATALFEEAAASLRDLGDEEHEAQIMANLGLAHRRHGRREEGDNVLQLALSKLTPASSAYHAIEAELRRAS